MKVFEVLGFIDDPHTQHPSVDDLLKNPEYHAKEKRRKAGVIWMSPDEYIEKVVQGFRSRGIELTADELYNSRSEKLIQQYAEEMKNGDKFPTVYLEYSRGFGQEGLHRVFAAKQLGIKKVPVIIVSLTRNKERKGKKSIY